MNPFDFRDMPPSAQAPARARPQLLVWALAGIAVFLAVLVGIAALLSRESRPAEPRPDAEPAPVALDGRVTPTPKGGQGNSLPAGGPVAMASRPAETDAAYLAERRRAFEAALTRMPNPPPTADFTRIDPGPLCASFVEPKRDPTTGFVVGGRNDRAVIRALTELNGRPIAELEADMRPEFPNETAHRSNAGFLSPDQRLLDVLVADNEYVVGTLGLTHQDLARPLKAMFAAGRWQVCYRPDGWPRPYNEWFDLLNRTRIADRPAFVYRGRRFRVVWTTYKGDQDSPFLDGTRTDTDVTVANLDTKKVLRYSLLVPEMIERYGFYEGPGTPYRVEPKDVVEVLDYLKPVGR